MEKLDLKKFEKLSNSEMQTIAGGRWRLVYSTLVPNGDGGSISVAVWTRRGHTRETYDEC